MPENLTQNPTIQKLLDGIDPIVQNRIVRQVVGWAVALAVFYFALTSKWDVPTGIIIQGIILGSLTALLAFGLALIWKSNRIINFAQADLGFLPASLCVVLVEVEGWSFWLAMPLMLLAATALGWIVERVFIRWRFEKAPRLIVMVVTIGLSTFLSGLAIALPYIIEGTDSILPSRLSQEPFQFNLFIRPFLFHAYELIAVIMTVLCIIGLFLFLRFTSIGIALRAGSESSDRASLLGVNVGFTHSVAWMIAGFLAGVTMILRAGVFGLPLGQAFGPEILLRALAAAVIGKMENFVVIFAAACGIGVIETAAQWNNAASYVDPLLFVIIIGALLFQRRRKESRVEDQATSSWQNTANVRPVPRELARLPEVKWAFRGLRLVLIAVLISLPFILSIKDTNLAALVAIYAIVAISLVLLTGWAGEISLGQFAFVAIGSMVVGTLNVNNNWGTIQSLVVAGIVGAVASVIIGLPALRIRGLMLAVTTLAFAVMTSTYLLNRDLQFLGIKFDYLPDPLIDRVSRYPIFGIHSILGTSIVENGVLNETGMYFLALIGLGLTLLAIRGLHKWRTVRDLIATRDNERNSQSFGLSPTRVKLIAFAIAGFIASFAGGLVALHQQAIGSQIFLPTESIRVLTMVVVGGLASVPGAILGAIFLQSTVWFSDWVPNTLRPAFQLLGSGLGLVIVLMFLPGGLGSVLYRIRDLYLRLVARRRNLVVPSLIADSGDPEVLTGRVRAPVIEADLDGGEVVDRAPKFLKLFPRRPVPNVDYFSYPDLALSGGTPNLLSLRSVDVAYGQVQVLFGVSLELREGETIALLGTNGAGKSTVLRAISGLVAPKRGSISHLGIDISGLAPHRVAERGLIQVPGGRGVFPSLTVGENLKVACWMHRHDKEWCNNATNEVLRLFPGLNDRLNDPAASLSGGQQQMLALGMAFLAKPKILMIDELSLGLAPLVVEQLLNVVREFKAQGMTVVLVEQSVNVALTTANKAFFMEKGQIRFHGLTAELLERPELLRSIFLEGAAKHEENGQEAAAAAPERMTVSVTENAAPVAGNGAERIDAGDQVRKVMLETRDVTKRFSGITAVDHVSLQLHDGEILGIIGPNGAGKTTFFDLISGFLVPDEGHIYFEGKEITRLRPQTRSRPGLARSFQDARLFGGLTVHQTVCVALDRQINYFDPVAESLHLPHVYRAEKRLGKRADELIDVMGVGDFRDKFVSDLSTGSRRIVDLACQIGVEPKVILFDEPSSGIAQRETEALGPLLLRIRDMTGASLLLIEHDMPLITSVSDRIVALDLGRVVVEGDADTVLNDPHVVASYLGSSREVIERSGSLAAHGASLDPAPGGAR
jgi:ABC-type branched-subunit amino acid transport system ATPase component/ABC-type branched-subunit amino acid transport system permease subunit